MQNYMICSKCGNQKPTAWPCQNCNPVTLSSDPNAPDFPGIGLPEIKKSTEEIADELLMRIATAETEDFDRDKGWIKQALDTERSVFTPHSTFQEYRKAWEDLDDERKAVIEKKDREIARLQKEVLFWREEEPELVAERKITADLRKEVERLTRKIIDVRCEMAVGDHQKAGIHEATCPDCCKQSIEISSLKSILAEKETEIDRLTHKCPESVSPAVGIPEPCPSCEAERYVDGLEKKIATLEAEINELKGIRTNALKFLDTELCDPHFEQAKKQSFDDFNKAQKDAGCRLCLKAHNAVLIEALKWISGDEDCRLEETPNLISPVSCVVHRNGLQCKAAQALHSPQTEALVRRQGKMESDLTKAYDHLHSVHFCNCDLEGEG